MAAAPTAAAVGGEYLPAGQQCAVTEPMALSLPRYGHHCHSRPWCGLQGLGMRLPEPSLEAQACENTAADEQAHLRDTVLLCDFDVPALLAVDRGRGLED